MARLISITDIPGFQVGHAQDEAALTGVTVILCPSGAVGGVDQRGGAPGTRETDALHPMHLVQRVHAVVLTGGSAFGLDAAAGVVRFLEERGVGFDVGVARVPIVPAAVLFDLGIGRADVRPDAAMGYQACLNASTAAPAQGNAGAGMGATVGKLLGIRHAMKAGIGSAGVTIGGGIRVAALAAVNAVGDVIDPGSGAIIAGVRAYTDGGVRVGRPLTGAEAANSGAQSAPTGAAVRRPPEYFADSLWVMQQRAAKKPLGFGRAVENTVIGVVATNARLNKEQTAKVAQMAQDGLARAIRPAHTMVDGDTIFALSLGSRSADVSVVGAFAAEVFAQAIVNAVWAAQSAAGLPSAGG